MKSFYKSFKMVYHQPDLVLSEWIEFSGVSEIGMIKLLGGCSVPSYGHKGRCDKQKLPKCITTGT